MGKINAWKLSEEQLVKFKPIIQEYIDKLENTSLDEETPDELELTLQGIGPYQLKELLETLGYEEDADEPMDTNGWQCDFWMNFNNPDRQNFARKLVIAGTGITFDLRLESGVDE